MPYEILNKELYLDRTVQDWHRAKFDRYASAMDVDLMGYCLQCRAPLYLIESSTNPNKPTTVLYTLAKRANVPAFLILHKDKRVIGGGMIYPERLVYSSESEISDALTAIRHNHQHGT